MKGTLVVVDALNYLFRAYHALPPLTTKAGLPTGAVYGFCQMLLRIDREQRPTHLCVVFDAPGATFRAELFPDYKANRPPTPPDLVAQIDLAHQAAAAFGCTVLSVPGVEADDVIATLVRQARAEDLAVVIGSSDKDLMQLCSEEVRLFDAVKNRLLGPGEVKEKWGVTPEQLGDVLALMGDTVDNVPGVAGIGPKTAAELISTYGSLAEVVANTDKIKGKKGQAIAESKAQLLLSRELVRLKDDVPLPKAMAEIRRAAVPFAELRELCQRLEFGRLLEQVVPTPGASQPAPPAASSGRASLAATPGAVSLVADAAGLQAMVESIRAARTCALSWLLERNTAVAAHLLGLAVALPGGQRFYVSVKQHLLGAAPGLAEAEVVSGTSALLADSGIGKHLHDAKALDVFLRMRGASLAGVVDDTMLAGYVLASGSGQYALSELAGAAAIPDVGPRPARRRDTGVVDVAATAKQLAAEAEAILTLAKRQNEQLEAAQQEHLYREVELALSPVLAAMECVGIRIDGDYLRRLGNEVATAARALESEIHGLAGTEFNIASPKQLAEILFGRLGLPVIKKTKTGPSTDADVLEQLAASHPLPAKVIEYRTLTKLKGTYIDALPALVNPRSGRLHTTFHQAVAATGRLSSSDPNLQNIPIRSDIGKQIRNAFVADPGFRMVSADYSQIELRVLAHFCEDPAFVAAFRAGADIHRRTAAEVFGTSEADVTAEQRRIAKAINFGLVFGQTDFGLAQTLRIPRAEAHQYIETYFARYARVREYMDKTIAAARTTQSVSTLLGRTRALPDINAKQPAARNYAERIARNTPIQGSAADILKLAMLRVHRGLGAFPKVRLLLTVHDELVFEVPESDLDAFCPWVKRTMEAAFELNVPLVVDVHHGATWGEAHS
jgi:DNA polymerase-1